LRADPEPEPEDERDLVADDFRPDDRRGEEALMPSPMPDKRLLVLLGVIGDEEMVAEDADFARMWSVFKGAVELNMLERPSVVVAPDLKGELDTSELPVTCLKLELVLLGPPPLDGGTGIALLSPSASLEEGSKLE